MKIIIFGGSGFLGSFVAEELIKRGHKVKIADIKKTSFKIKKCKFVKVNILNKKNINDQIKGHDVVYNFAAVADIQDAYDNPLLAINTNILGTTYVLEACIKHKVKRFIFASSIYVLSNQGGFYKASKQSAEILIKEYGEVHNLPYTILRFGSIYGPRSNIKNGLYKIVYDAVTKKKLIYQGTKKAVRSYIHARDAAKASADILRNKFKNKIILIQGNKSLQISNLLNKLKKIMNIDKNLIYLNKTQKGHYDKSPIKYKEIRSQNYRLRKYVDLEEGLKELIINLKKKNQ